MRGCVVASPESTASGPRPQQWQLSSSPIWPKRTHRVLATQPVALLPYLLSLQVIRREVVLVASVKCPRCNSFTPNEPVSLRDGNSLAVSDMSIVQCMACSGFFVAERRRPVWPLTCPPAPAGVPEKVREAYENARIAHAAGANLAALMAGRIALERFLGDKQAKSYKELAEKQIITPAIFAAVDQLRLWANISGHDDIDVDTFDAKEVEDILDYLGTALEQAYTHQARVDGFVQRTKELREKPDSA